MTMNRKKKKQALMRVKERNAYVPQVKAKQIKGTSVPCVIVDYKTGRSVELLSQGEKYIWYLLRFDDNVQEIYEQYPLDLNITMDLARTYGIKHPRNNSTPMTTDFLVERKHDYVAYSVKNDRSVLDNPRTIEKLFLEKKYWERVGVEFHPVFKEDLNMILINNIMDVVSCYDRESVFSRFDELRYQIAHKMIEIDLSHEPINYKTMLKEQENE